MICSCFQHTDILKAHTIIAHWFKNNVLSAITQCKVCKLNSYVKAINDNDCHKPTSLKIKSNETKQNTTFSEPQFSFKKLIDVVLCKNKRSLMMN